MWKDNILDCVEWSNISMMEDANQKTAKINIYILKH